MENNITTALIICIVGIMVCIVAAIFGLITFKRLNNENKRLKKIEMMANMKKEQNVNALSEAEFNTLYKIAIATKTKIFFIMDKPGEYKIFFPGDSKMFPLQIGIALFHMKLHTENACVPAKVIVDYKAILRRLNITDDTSTDLDIMARNYEELKNYTCHKFDGVEHFEYTTHCRDLKNGTADCDNCRNTRK